MIACAMRLLKTVERLLNDILNQGHPSNEDNTHTVSSYVQREEVLEITIEIRTQNIWAGPS